MQPREREPERILQHVSCVTWENAGVCNVENPCVTQHKSPSKKAEQTLAFWASYASKHMADQFIGPYGPLFWLCVEIPMFCMQIIEWISASEDYGWCAGKGCPSPCEWAYKSDRWKILPVFSWTENPPSSLGPLKLECCWKNTLLRVHKSDFLKEVVLLWALQPEWLLGEDVWMLSPRGKDYSCWAAGLSLSSLQKYAPMGCYVYILPIAPGGTQHAYGPYASSWQVLQAPSR